jgi:predicted AAA+ superfamily ATPase
MYTDLLKEKISDFHARPLPSYTPRDYKISFIDDMSFSITGPRRCGKTYRTYQFVEDYIAKGNSIENICRIQFNDHKLIKLRSEDLGMIDEAYYALYPEKKEHREEVIFIFDEIHRIDGWEDYILHLLDTLHHKVIITGSTSKIQKGEIASALRGKNFNREILPFSFREFMRHHGRSSNIRTSEDKAYARKLFTMYISQGSFPGLLNSSSDDHSEILENYWNTMLLRDIVEANQREEKIDILQLETFAQYLINRTSLPMTVRRVMEGMKKDNYPISSAKAYNYLKYLEDAFIIFPIHFYSMSEKIRRSNYTKIYAIDWKLADTIATGGNIDITRQFENIIYLELRRRNNKVCYFKTRDNYEIDFVAQNKKTRTPPDLYQVCYDISSSDTLERETRSIEKSFEYLNAKSATIITFADEKVIKRKNITINIIPAWKWLLSTAPF